jgi:formate-dependent phosphoribosylglycinamide formyltransferase (GAR transformylase)
MRFVVIAFPHFTEHCVRIVERALDLPDVRLGLVTAVPQEELREDLRVRLAGHWRLDVWDLLKPERLGWAVEELSKRCGKVERLFSPQEHVQVPCAVVREWFKIPGMPVEQAKNFRDKARMKQLLREAGLPCARYRRVDTAAAAWEFVKEVGYPVILKPLEGAASQVTFKAENDSSLRDALNRQDPAPHQPVIAEEFITGEEHSIDTFTRRGRPLFHTVTNYFPSCLEVMRNPWMQWVVVLPREVDDPRFDDIRKVAFRALEVLGMDSGMTHLEWFRRPDGSPVISEVGARPPGAQFTTLVSRHTGVDALTAWLRLVLDESFETPKRRFAASIAFLRGQGQGRVKAVHGLDEVQRKYAPLISDLRLPMPGQEPGTTYEGEGYVIFKHPETAVVEEAAKSAVSTVRVVLG